jgi:hypothetical protein
LADPAFRDFGGEQNRKPPGLFDRTSFYYFPLRADPGALSAYVSRIFQTDGGPTYTAPLPWVLLAFTHVEHLHSDDPDKGSIRYKDIALWIPVRRQDNGALLLFPGYMFVDNASTMATGREMFGFPKQMGQFEMPIGGPFGAFSASCVGRKNPADVEALSRIFRIVPNQQPPDEATGILGKVVHAATGLLQSIEHLFAGALEAVIAQVLGDLPKELFHLMPGSLALGLQQCRDPEKGDLASHLAIVETEIRIEKLHDFKGVRNPGRFELETLASHPIAQDLGIASQDVPIGLFFLADAAIRGGKVVWRAP